LAETVSDPLVVRRELMGGRWQAFVFVTAGLSAGGRTNYIGILLGPERTRECFLSRK
jgi:hypothetical protein